MQFVRYYTYVEVFVLRGKGIENNQLDAHCIAIVNFILRVLS